jgi:hypothetical protein
MIMVEMQLVVQAEMAEPASGLD